MTFVRHGQPSIIPARPGVLRRHALRILAHRVVKNRSGEKGASSGDAPVSIS